MAISYTLFPVSPGLLHRRLARPMLSTVPSFWAVAGAVGRLRLGRQAL